MSIERETAQAVAETISGGTFEIGAVTAERGWLPEFDEQKLGKLKVTCIPLRMTIDNAARGKQKFEIEISTAVQQRIKPQNQDTEIDTLNDLCSVIRDFLRAETQRTINLSGGLEAKYKQQENRPVVDPGFLQVGVFTSMITATYIVFK